MVFEQEKGKCRASTRGDNANSFGRIHKTHNSSFEITSLRTDPRQG